MTALSQRELVNRALTNDREPTQGYILEELAKLTFTSSQKCTEVAEVFLKPLTATSARTSAKTIHRVIKALRALRYICEKGNGQFRELLQASVSVIKFYTTFNIPERDAVHGDAFIQQVRKEAQKCVAVLYEDQFLSNATATQGTAGGSDRQILLARKTETGVLYNCELHGAPLDSTNPNKYSISKFYVYNDEAGERNDQGRISTRFTQNCGSEHNAQNRDTAAARGATAHFTRSTPENISSSMSGSKVAVPRSRKMEGFGNPYFCKEDGPKFNGGYSASNMSNQFSSETFRNRIMSMATSATGESGGSLATVVNNSTENIVSGFSHAVSAVGKYIPQPVREKLDAVIGNNISPQHQQGRFSSSGLFPSNRAPPYDSFSSQTASSTSSSVGVVDFSNRFRFSGQRGPLSTSSSAVAQDPATLWAVRSKAADCVSGNMVPNITEPRKSLISPPDCVDHERTISTSDNTTTETASRIVMTTLINGVCEKPTMSLPIIEDFVRRSYRYPHPEHVVVGILDQLFPASSTQWQGSQSGAFVGIPSWSRRHKLLTLLLALLADDVRLSSILNASGDINEAETLLAQAQDQRVAFAESIRALATDVLGRLKKQTPRSTKLVDEILQVAERFAPSPLEASEPSPRDTSVCDPPPVVQPPPDLLGDFEEKPLVLAESRLISSDVCECPDLLEDNPHLVALNDATTLSSSASASAPGQYKASRTSHAKLTRGPAATVTPGDLLLDMLVETNGSLTTTDPTVSFTAPNATLAAENRSRQQRDPLASQGGSLFSGLQVTTPTEETLNEFLAVSAYPKSTPSISAVTVHDILDLEKSPSLIASSCGPNAVSDTLSQARLSNSHPQNSPTIHGVSATASFPFTASAELQPPPAHSSPLCVGEELVSCKTQQCITAPLDMTVPNRSLDKNRFTEPELRSSCFNFVK